jgi:hypothetical protein
METIVFENMYILYQNMYVLYQNLYVLYQMRARISRFS